VFRSTPSKYPPAPLRCACVATAGVLFFLALALLGGCSQFGVPELPAAYRDPTQLHESVVVAYRPDTVLGFGHTGVIVKAPPEGYARFDQYASAEWAYGERLSAGTAHFWQTVTSRVPSIFGFTREFITRREAGSVNDLLEPGELAIPLPTLDSGKVYAAALARWRNANELEDPAAPRYVWMFNNCHHFVRDVLREGGGIPEAYFPKHWVAEAVEALPRR